MNHMKISPNLCAGYDEEKNEYDIEVELPGVNKEEVELKVLPGGFMVRAKKGDMEYTGDYTFCCPVEDENTTAEFDNGLLKIRAPLREPFKKARKISVK